ncbi:STAS/SEC14 domain-containing protein [Roseovarius sp. ZX-A-9]|uniref:STAS/SEC14 domain-containing protein n=1 Tax=Roseovarius sp. ZX-A-9 TaxID=3014783 RepID=UPI00232F5DE5|nr:STAS/SEC14 domain-containing protein [Roseovarius sp. ZX-A-9]
MLKVRELSRNVYELTLSGVVEKTDIETMARELTPVLQGDGPLGLIVRAEDLADVTADAIIEDAKFEFGMLNQWTKIAKLAVVTDLQAFSALLKWIDPVLPMIDMRSFPSSDIAAAEAFASDLPAPQAGADASGMRLLADGSDGVIAFEIDGLITREDVQKVMAPLEPILRGDKKINLFAKFTSYGGFDPAILMDGSFMGSKIDAIAHVGRYAIVGAPSWMKALTAGVSPMMPFEMRLFDAADEAEARSWVGMK